MKSQFTTICILFLITAFSGVASGQIPSAETRMRNFNVKNANIVEMLRKLSTENDLPVSLWLKTENSESENSSTASLSLRKTTLRSVCDSIAKAFPDYDWTLVSGVLRFAPKTRSVGISDLLSQEISDFVLSGKLAYPRLRWKILSISEVRMSLEKHGLTSEAIELKYTFGQELPRFSIDVNKATLSDILDSVIKQGTRRMWVVSEKADQSVVLNFM